MNINYIELSYSNFKEIQSFTKIITSQNTEYTLNVFNDYTFFYSSPKRIYLPDRFK